MIYGVWSILYIKWYLTTCMWLQVHSKGINLDVVQKLVADLERKYNGTVTSLVCFPSMFYAYAVIFMSLLLNICVKLPPYFSKG